MKLTPEEIISSLEADVNYLLDPLFEYWNENYYKTYAYFIVLLVMVANVIG